jgi:5-methylcytosine-specific restriction protein A
MPSVFVYSAGKAAVAHYQRTIQTGVPLSLFQPIIPAAVYATLQEAYPDGICYLWGDRGGEHGRQYWQQIGPGDLALCYRNRRIAAASTVIATVENEAAGLAAWPDATSEPYRLLFFLSKPVWTDVPVASLPQYFGKSYQGLRRLPKSQKILEEFGSLERFASDSLLRSSSAVAAVAGGGMDRVGKPSFEDPLPDAGVSTLKESDPINTAPPLKSRRNPPWSRDELVLALNLYFRVDRSSVSSTHPDVVALSALLNRLQLHGNAHRNGLYRNPNGVSMKLMNFLRCDPNYEGVGLARGGKLEQQIWDEYSGDREALEKAAASIAQAVDFLEGETQTQGVDDSGGFVEGGVLEVVHRRRERSRMLVDRKKSAVVRETGFLRCEACGFDFQQFYGDLGEGFAECHHRSPLSDIAQSRTTLMADLAIVCANCHRMLHRKRPWMTVEELVATLALNRRS